MKIALYLRLALSGIRKNKKLYFPYLLTCIGMVMMSHILQSLSYSPTLHMMRGGSQMEFILSLGKVVVAVFAGLFLLYTNSFLIRRRNKEFGLYNVLGMDKTALSWVICWENILVAMLGLSVGLLLGIGEVCRYGDNCFCYFFSKVAFCIVFKLCKNHCGNVLRSIILTVYSYFVIFTHMSLD